MGKGKMMSRFCKYCGEELAPGARFCAKCGKEQEAMQESHDMAQPNQGRTEADGGQTAEEKPQAEKGRRGNVVGKVVMMLLLLILVFGGGYVGYRLFFDEAPANTANVKTEKGLPSSPAAKQASAKEEKEKADKDSDALAKMHGVLESYNIADQVLATTGADAAGSLSVTQTADGHKRLVAVDMKNKQVGVLALSKNLYDFAEKADHGKGKVLLSITILNDKHDNDKDYGTWNGKNHIFPILAEFSIDGSGSVTPGMLTSGKGANPVAYQEVLYEPKNVDLANLILTQMKNLHKDVEERGVNI